MYTVGDLVEEREHVPHVINGEHGVKHFALLSMRFS